MAVLQEGISAWSKELRARMVLWGSGVLKPGGVVYRRLGETSIDDWGSGVLKAMGVVY